MMGSFEGHCFPWSCWLKSCMFEDVYFPLQVDFGRLSDCLQMISTDVPSLQFLYICANGIEWYLLVVFVGALSEGKDMFVVCLA